MPSTPSRPDRSPAGHGFTPFAYRAAFAALALLAAAAPSRAAIAPEARPVVERYVKALGGRKALEGVRSLYEKGSLQAFGMKGSSEFWIQRPDRVATRISIGPITVADGFDGAAGWRIDPGGKTIVLDGKDLDDAKSNAWFGNERWLLPDQGGGTVNFAGTESDSTGRWAVLEVIPPAGRSRRMYFDEKTGLLARSVSKRDQHTVETTPSDYRRVGALLQPFRTYVHVVELPANDITITLDSVAVNAEILPGRFSPPAEAASPVRWLGSAGRARLPFDYATRHLWLRASVNGAPAADFIFDTGASLTVLDSAYAAGIGLRTEGRQQGQGAGATGGASFARLDSLRVAAADGDGVTLRDLKVGVLSLNPVLAPYFWRDVAGVVGFDFISRFVVEIDYDSTVLILHDPKGFRYAGKGEAIPMTLAGSIPVVDVNLAERWSGPCRVDVGSGATLDLHTPFVRQHGLLALPGPSVEVTGGGFGGTFQITTRRLKSLRVGKLAVSDPVVGLSQATKGGFASEDYAGNLGNRWLERFRVTLDYERRTLWLEPARRFAEREVFPRSGLQLMRQDGTVRAARVLPGSPAAEAGVREGDEVTTIDGEPVERWTAERVSAELERGAEGSRHTLVLRRGGATLTATLTLRELL